MDTAAGIVVAGLVMVGVALIVVVARGLSRRQSQIEVILRDELRQSREESAKASRELREEMANGLSRAQDHLASTLTTTSGVLKGSTQRDGGSCHACEDLGCRSVRRQSCGVGGNAVSR
jgi:hypothetical protein